MLLPFCRIETATIIPELRSLVKAKLQKVDIKVA